jgi:hypothetical protein
VLSLALVRVFKTAWFSKAARKARIHDSELCKAINQVMLGQADDLGGGVYKKRLKDNQYRSIILAKSGEFWVFAYLFAKKDRANISNEELLAFRRLADLYRLKKPSDVEKEVKIGELEEICNDKNE